MPVGKLCLYFYKRKKYNKILIKNFAKYRYLVYCIGLQILLYLKKCATIICLLKFCFSLYPDPNQDLAKMLDQDPN
jgi:hypothetical protein